MGTFTIRAGENTAAAAARLGVSVSRLRGILGGQLNPPAGTYTTSASIADAPSTPATSGSTAGKADTNPKTKPGLLEGGRLIRRRFGPGGVSDDIYYMTYEFPPGSGKWVAYEFNDPKQVIATLGKLPDVTSVDQNWWNRNVIAEGKAEEVIGVPGNWKAYTQEMMRDAALAAGVNDPGLAGQIANNKEMQQIMVLAMMGDWTPEQIKAEQRKTKFWQDTLYPGIKNLYGLTTEPEKAYADYLAQAEPALEALGYPRGSAGGYKAAVKKMLDKKIDISVFMSQVPVFIRAVQNAEFAGVLNQWAERDLGREIGFTDWFNLMAGESQPDLDALAEKATLEWVAQNQGTQLSQAEVEGLAGRTQMSAEEAQQAMSEFNTSVLALGDEALNRYGLTRDEVLSASAGVVAASGRSVDEVKQLVAKTAREQSLADDDKINFYVGFTPMGTPTRPGLQALAPEGA